MSTPGKKDPPKPVEMYSSSLEQGMPPYSASGGRHRKSRKRHHEPRVTIPPGSIRAHTFPVSAAMELLKKLNMESDLSETAKKIIRLHQLETKDGEADSLSDGSTGGTSTTKARYVVGGISDHIPYIVIPEKIETQINDLIKKYAQEKSRLKPWSETLSKKLNKEKSEKLRALTDSVARLTQEKTELESLLAEASVEDRSHLEANLKELESKIKIEEGKAESIASNSPIFTNDTEFAAQYPDLYKKMFFLTLQHLCKQALTRSGAGSEKTEDLTEKVVQLIEALNKLSNDISPLPQKDTHFFGTRDAAMPSFRIIKPKTSGGEAAPHSVTPRAASLVNSPPGKKSAMRYLALKGVGVNPKVARSLEVKEEDGVAYEVETAAPSAPSGTGEEGIAARVEEGNEAIVAVETRSTGSAAPSISPARMELPRRRDAVVPLLKRALGEFSSPQPKPNTLPTAMDSATSSTRTALKFPDRSEAKVPLTQAALGTLAKEPPPTPRSSIVSALQYLKGKGHI